MKLNFSFVKKYPLPTLLVALVVIVVVWAVTRGGGSSGGGGTVVQNSGPSDAATQANAQLTMAQLAAGTQVQLAQIDAATQGGGFMAQLEAARIAAGIAATQIGAQLQLGLNAQSSQDLQTIAGRDIQLAGIAATLQGQRDQLQTTFNLAELSADMNRYAMDTQVTLNAQNQFANIATQQINAQTLSEQMRTNADMFAAQLASNNHQFDAQIGLAQSQIAAQNQANNLSFLQNLAVNKPVWWANNGTALLTQMH